MRGGLDEVQGAATAAQHSPAGCERLCAPWRVSPKERDVDRPRGTLVSAPTIPVRHVAELKPVCTDTSPPELCQTERVYVHCCAGSEGKRRRLFKPLGSRLLRADDDRPAELLLAGVRRGERERHVLVRDADVDEAVIRWREVIYRRLGRKPVSLDGGPEGANELSEESVLPTCLYKADPPRPRRPRSTHSCTVIVRARLILEVTGSPPTTAKELHCRLEKRRTGERPRRGGERRPRPRGQSNASR